MIHGQFERRTTYCARECLIVNDIKLKLCWSSTKINGIWVARTTCRSNCLINKLFNYCVLISNEILIWACDLHSLNILVLKLQKNWLIFNEYSIELYVHFNLQFGMANDLLIWYNWTMSYQEIECCFLLQVIRSHAISKLKDYP
jgi:hypothetical protein